MASLPRELFYTYFIHIVTLEGDSTRRGDINTQQHQELCTFRPLLQDGFGGPVLQLWPGLAYPAARLLWS